MSFCQKPSPAENSQPTDTNPYPGATASEGLGAMFRQFRGKPPEREATLVLRLREKIIIALAMFLLTSLLGVINSNVSFLVRVIPAKVLELERKQVDTDASVKELQAEQKLDNEHKGRVIGVLERHEDRLKRLERER
jgi:hypothetical protein